MNLGELMRIADNYLQTIQPSALLLHHKRMHQTMYSLDLEFLLVHPDIQSEYVIQNILLS